MYTSVGRTTIVAGPDVAAIENASVFGTENPRKKRTVVGITRPLDDAHSRFPHTSSKR